MTVSEDESFYDAVAAPIRDEVEGQKEEKHLIYESFNYPLLRETPRGPSLHRVEVLSPDSDGEQGQQQQDMMADDCACMGPWPDNETLRVRCGQSSWGISPR